MRNPLFLLNILTSAFLLFQIQPILAKSILPAFGGGASVWTACMVFFQGVLLLGYLHAYCISKLQSGQLQVVLQAIILFVSWILAWLLLKAPAIPYDLSQPVLSILWILCQQIGLPFFVLSSTGILLQFWYTQQTSDKRAPYHWYAWSNASSLITLLAYPFLWEPYLDLVNQKWIWMGVYSVFSISYFILLTQLYKTFGTSQITSLKPIKSAGIKSPIWLKWLAWSTAGTMLLLSTTHMLTLNISPMPFLWLLPLALYLISYILAFSKLSLYNRSYWMPVFIFCLLASLLMYFLGSQFNSLSQIIMYTLILFVTCLLCHCELSLSAPCSQNLTLFYLCIACGGWIGSMLTSIAAPLLFVGLVEYPLAIFCVYCLICLSYCTPWPKTGKRDRIYAASWLVGLVLLPGGYILLGQAYSRFDIANTRNFYGHLSVKEVPTPEGMSRRLVDGTTVHGSQNMKYSVTKTLDYYGPTTGISVAINYMQQQSSLKMAIIGLGAGVLASYARHGDKIDFYELNPAVKVFAYEYFDYLHTTLGNIEIKLGDGRLSLAKELKQSGSNNLDLLVIDAFTSDSIPTHLLTQEAFALYWQHIRTNGLLVIHISNSHLDLKPVIAAQGQTLGKTSLFFKTQSRSISHYASEWLVMTKNAAFIAEEIRLKRATQLNNVETILWTDNFSSLITVLKI